MNNYILPNDTDQGSCNTCIKTSNDDISDISHKTLDKSANDISNNSTTIEDNGKQDLNENEEDVCDYSFDFILDKTLIDTNIVKRIGIDRWNDSVSHLIPNVIIHEQPG
jgi:hypothetical protein